LFGGWSCGRDGKREVAELVHLNLLIGPYDGGRARVLDDRRAGHHLPGGQVACVVDRGVEGLADFEVEHLAHRYRRSGLRWCGPPPLQVQAAGRPVDPHRGQLDSRAAQRRTGPVAGLVLLDEAAHQVVEPGLGDLFRRQWYEQLMHLEPEAHAYIACGVYVLAKRRFAALFEIAEGLFYGRWLYVVGQPGEAGRRVLPERPREGPAALGQHASER